MSQWMVGVGIGRRSPGGGAEGGNVRGGEWAGGAGEWAKRKRRTAESFQEGEKNGLNLSEAKTKKEDYTTVLMTVFLSLTLIVVIMSIMRIWC